MIGTPGDAESNDLITSFQQALRPHGPNFTINLDRYTWRVHKDVVARKSEFFNKICMGTSWKENGENTVTLHDDKPFVFTRVLQFIYHGEYTYTLGVTTARHRTGTITGLRDLLISGEDDSLYPNERDEDYEKPLDVLNLEVYDLADKYGIPTLKEFSLRELVMNATDSFDEADLRSLFAEYYPNRTDHDRSLKSALAECIARMFDTIRNDENEWDKGIGRWMREDFELCTMVMEQLRHQDKKELEDSESDEY